MTSVEDRLRDLGTIVLLPDLPTVEELVTRREDRRRRRRRCRGFGVVAVVSLIGAAVVAFERAGGTQGSQDLAIEGFPDTASPSCDIPSVPSDVTVEALAGDGVPAVLVAELRQETSGAETGESGELESAGIAVIDLDKGCRAIYPSGALPFELEGQPDTAVLTGDELFVWGFTKMPMLAFPAGRTADGHHELVAGGLQGPGREVRGSLGFGRAIPTRSGDAMWVQIDDLDGNFLELIDTATGELQQSVPIEPTMELAGVAGEDAFLVPMNMVQVGSEASIVSTSSETTTIELPQPGSFVGVSSTHSFWITDIGPGDAGIGESLMTVSHDSQDTTSIPVPEDQEGQWVWASSPGDPQTMGTVRADGSRLLVAFSVPGTTHLDSIAVVDVEEGTSEVVSDSAGFAFWAQDDRTVVVVDGTDVTAVDTVTGETTTIEGALPGPGLIASR